MSDRFPKATTDGVKRDDSLMVYPTFAQMGIGARASGLPSKASDGPKNLEHVGTSSSKKK